MPPPPVRLTAAAARALHLAAQGLLLSPPRRVRKQDLVDAIARMQLVQIDTIHVVARSPYLALFSRLGAYSPEWLDELLADASVFETWAHEACLAPIADWPVLRSQLQHKDGHWAIRAARRAQLGQNPGMRHLLEHVRRHGPVRSSDFPRSERGDGWWSWSDEKRWLEAWFALGELMVLRRERFQRIYDLSERVLARAGIDPGMPRPDRAETRQRLIERSVLALGVARTDWLADYYRLGAQVRPVELEPLLETGRIRTVEVAGWSAPGYVHRDAARLLLRAASGRLRASASAVLSPFDPVVWHRERALALFGFDYRLECYTPAAKRTYGYFVLPLLHRGRLLARLDAKAHRLDGCFEIKGLWFEEQHLALAEDDLDAIAATLTRCARWHGCDRVVLGKVRPARVARSVQAALRRAAGLPVA